MSIIPEKEYAAVEDGARVFAAITSEAHEIAPLLAQEFTVRIKSNKEAARWLDCAYHPMSKGKSMAKLLGKTVKVKVDWGACGGVEHQRYIF